MTCMTYMAPYMAWMTPIHEMHDMHDTQYIHKIHDEIYKYIFFTTTCITHSQAYMHTHMHTCILSYMIACVFDMHDMHEIHEIYRT